MHPSLAHPYVRARHLHRPLQAPNEAELLGDEARESLDPLPRGVAVSILERIDFALSRGEQGQALSLERLLPSTLGTEPAVIDRLATLRLIEGDATTAGAALGACPQSTPRLDLLRLIVAIQRDGAANQQPIDNGCVVARILRSLVNHVGAGEVSGDPTAAVCSIVAGHRSPVATLTAALLEIDRLLDSGCRGSLSERVLAAMHGVARDLGIALMPTAAGGELAVTPGDCARLRLRAA